MPEPKKQSKKAHALVGYFDTPADLFHCCETLRDEGYKDFDAHTPFPVHGLEHAMEPAGEHRGVRFVNDSKATNVDSARHAIESFEHGLVPIIGGRFKGGDLRDLREPLRARARAVVAIGESRDRVREALAGTVDVHVADSMREAVQRAFELALPDVEPVILGPGDAVVQRGTLEIPWRCDDCASGVYLCRFVSAAAGVTAPLIEPITVLR